MMDLCSVLISYAFQLAPFVFFLLQKAHGGGLMGHFGVKKTDDVLATHFFWPKKRRDVERFVARCTTCQKAKSRLNPHGFTFLYLYLVFRGRTYPWTLF